MSNLNLHLGDYKGEAIHVFGGGFDKVNLITGMKGGGKSHITKGIISESIKSNMSAIVFDYNNEYDKISEQTIALKPTVNFKFRLDYMEVESLFRMVERLAPFPPATGPQAYSKLPGIIEARKEQRKIPDLNFLKGASDQVISGKSEAEKNMKYAYERSIEVLQNYKLIMTEDEALGEDKAIQESKPASIISLRTAFSNMWSGQPQILTFQIGGLPVMLQKTILTLVIDHLKMTCNKQAEGYEKTDRRSFPIYPTVFFEEAHNYMDTRDIDELVPIIRHIGINIFFVTNTPGALPDSVFRLLDNLIMTRMVNRKDIDRVADCGLTDKDTIVGFAQNLKDYHALFLSAKNGATKGFPLVLKIRDFGLPKSGQTRSQWEAMSNLQRTSMISDVSTSEDSVDI